MFFSGSGILLLNILLDYDHFPKGYKNMRKAYFPALATSPLSRKKECSHMYMMRLCLFTKLRHHLLKWQTLLARTSTEHTLLGVKMLKIVLQLSSDHRSHRKKTERPAERLANPPSGSSFQDWRHRTPATTATTATNRTSLLSYSSIAATTSLLRRLRSIQQHENQGEVRASWHWPSPIVASTNPSDGEE